LPNSTGKLPWPGIGWYRKHFNVSPGEKDNLFFIDFDGAMSHAKIWINGKYIGEWPYGYASFRFEITPYICFTEENVIAVRLDNPPNSSRWYPGGGIYRNVWLVKTAPVHIAHWGKFSRTYRNKNRQSD
jgi:beta-galactosidase